MPWKDPPLLEEGSITVATIGRLNKILGNIDNYDAPQLIFVFLKLMRDYFKAAFFMKGEFTYEELTERVGKVNIEEKIKNNLVSFIRFLLHLNYSERGATKEELKSLINQAKIIVNGLKREPTDNEKETLILESKKINLEEEEKGTEENPLDDKKITPIQVIKVVALVLILLGSSAYVWYYWDKINQPIILMEIPDITMYQNIPKINTINLDSFFISERSLEYSVINNKYLNITINEYNRLSLSPPKDWSGVDYMIVRVLDKGKYIHSNNVKITVLESGCGDSICQLDETCSNCSIDCGLCKGEEGASEGSETESEEESENELMGFASGKGNSKEEIKYSKIKNPILAQLFEIPSYVTFSISPTVSSGEGNKKIEGTSIAYNDININPIPCVVSDSSKNKTGMVIFKKSENIEKIGLPEGYSMLIPPFYVKCSGEDLDVTLTLPKNFEDISSIKCKNNNCSPYILREVDDIRCEDSYSNDMEIRNIFINSQYEDLDIQEVKKELQIRPDGTYFNSGKTKFILYGNEKLTLEVTKSGDDIILPKNPSITLLSTPITLMFESKKNISMEIIMPYKGSEGIEETSIAMYLNVNNTEWEYIESELDQKNKTVKGNLKNIGKYLDNSNKISIGLMGVLCRNCINSTFEKAYSPIRGSKDAVILVHGLLSSPSTFQELIDDIKLTEQPWQVWVYGYPSNKLIESNAIDLANKIEQKKNEYENIYLVGHSLGGLITQQALYYSYESNQKIPDKYQFLKKVKKVILVGTPNKGSPISEVYTSLYQSFVNAKTNMPLFNMKNDIVKEAMDGRNIPKVPGIEYNVVVGNQSMQMTQHFFKIYGEVYDTNDGIITTDSASFVGNNHINAKDVNYWELNLTHTELIDDIKGRKAIESAIAKNIIDNTENIPIMGQNKYFELPIINCSQSYDYAVMGKRKEDK